MDFLKIPEILGLSAPLSVLTALCFGVATFVGADLAKRYQDETKIKPLIVGLFLCSALGGVICLLIGLHSPKSVRATAASVTKRIEANGKPISPPNAPPAQPESPSRQAELSPPVLPVAEVSVPTRPSSMPAPGDPSVRDLGSLRVTITGRQNTGASIDFTFKIENRGPQDARVTIWGVDNQKAGPGSLIITPDARFPVTNFTIGGVARNTFRRATIEIISMGSVTGELHVEGISLPEGSVPALQIGMSIDSPNSLGQPQAVIFRFVK